MTAGLALAGALLLGTVAGWAACWWRSSAATELRRADAEAVAAETARWELIGAAAERPACPHLECSGCRRLDARRTPGPHTPQESA